MESFSLLKYWRASAALANVRSTSTSNSAIATSALVPATEKDNVAGGDEEEDGSFFDLEFSSAIAATANENSMSISESDGDEEVDEEKEKEKEKEMSLTVSDDLFFNATLVPLETSAILLSPSSDSDPKAIFPISFLKSATRFRVFTKKNRSNADTDTDSPKKSSNFFIRFINVEEVPIVSLFGGSRKTKPDQVVPADQEKKFLVQKYIDKIKPLYVRVSRRYGDRLGFSGQLTVEGPAAAGGAGDQTARVATGFRVVMKRLGKSKSASSSAVAAVPSPPVSIKNTDDSILHQEDGIQSAIAHCKKSFNYSPKD